MALAACQRIEETLHSSIKETLHSSIEETLHSRPYGHPQGHRGTSSCACFLGNRANFGTLLRVYPSVSMPSKGNAKAGCYLITLSVSLTV
eukprot:1161785-Pelagomonas_calceolata.AAC.2